jgi:hypothetical protein
MRNALSCWLPTAPDASCRRVRNILRILALLLFPSLVAPQVFAQKKPTRYDVEAAYLYQFGNFVQWPAKKADAIAPQSFSICVLGRDPFGRVLDQTIKGGKINGVPLAARRVGSAEESAKCQIVFVSTSEDNELAHDLEVLRQAPVLTVSDIPDFDARGGMIQFVLVGDRVRFEIDLSNAQRTGLTLSSQLLKVALAVRGGQNPEK